tara:strand:- start:752 stop:1369 length:618 start_codon:yes stop_codon:yes gene_type:complete
MGAEQAQRIGKKTGKWKGRFKKVVAGGLALGAVALGIKADNTITKIDRQQREEAGAYISGISRGLDIPQASGLAGYSSEGVMTGTQQQAQGIQGGDPTKFRGGGTALDTTPAGSGKKQGLQQAITSGAGLIAGQTSLGSAVKDVAGAVFEGRKDPTQEQLAAAERGAQAGATTAAGAEGVKASNRELIGQLAGKLKPKKPKRFAG